MKANKGFIGDASGKVINHYAIVAMTTQTLTADGFS